MFKKTALFIVALATSLTVFAGRTRDITMLIVPREVIPARIAMDIARRYPAIVVTYQGSGDRLKIQAWDGKSWVGISHEDYVRGSFFMNPPTHAILVEDPMSPAPDLLVPDGTWCASGSRLKSTDARVMIHLLGLYFNFPYRTWKDFAHAYRYPIEEINPGLINIPWWHYRGDELYKRQRHINLDMDLWDSLNITPPVVPSSPPALPMKPQEEKSAVPVIQIPAADAPVPDNSAFEKPAPETDLSDKKLPPAVSDPSPSTDPMTETTPAPSVPKPSESSPVLEADPFLSSGDVPAAEVVKPE